MSKGTRITKRWIDADGIMRACYNSLLTTDNKAYSEIIALIEAVPNTDVVEVVRCKDCRFHEDEQIGMVYCPAVVGGWVEDNWFCKGGEREDE